MREKVHQKLRSCFNKHGNIIMIMYSNANKISIQKRGPLIHRASTKVQIEVIKNLIMLGELLEHHKFNTKQSLIHFPQIQCKAISYPLSTNSMESNLLSTKSIVVFKTHTHTHTHRYGDGKRKEWSG